MSNYHYRITTEIPIQKNRGSGKVTIANAIEFYHPDVESTGRTNWSEMRGLEGKLKNKGWTNWSSGTFKTVDECVEHCSQYFPYRIFEDFRIMEVGETKFVHINAKKNDNINRVLLHIEEV